MTTFIILYLVSIPVFIIGDLTWLGFIARDFYFSQLGGMLRTPPNWYAAVTFYALFLLGLTFFATYPGYLSGSLIKTIVIGAFFGFIAYATYDLTNLATLKNWPLYMSIVDMVWGAFLGGAVAGITFSIVKFFQS